MKLCTKILLILESKQKRCDFKIKNLKKGNNFKKQNFILKLVMSN